MFQELKEHRPITIIGIVQIGLVAGGWILTAGHMKYLGYPDPPEYFIWNPESLFVRQWGLLLFLVPIGWVAATLFLESNHRFTIPKPAYVALGILMTLALFLLLWEAAIHPGHYPIRTFG